MSEKRSFFAELKRRNVDKVAVAYIVAGYRSFELALAHYARRDRPAADAALSEMVARDRNLLAYQIAEVYAWRGETDKAFEWLQVSHNNHDTGLLSLLIDPLMRGLRNDPRYKVMLEKTGLPTSL
jgi:serine/threonine-protein kinase